MLLRLREKSRQRWLFEIAALMIIEFLFLTVITNSFSVTSSTGFNMIEGTLLLLAGYLAYLAFGLKLNQWISLIIACSFVTIMAVTPFAVTAITTPRWSFKITTDKPSFSLGENVTITATLEDTGYFTQSFTSISPQPIQAVVSEEDNGGFGLLPVWVSNYYEMSNTTETVPTGHTITATYVWNGENTFFPDTWDTKYENGTFLIEVFVTALGKPEAGLQAEFIFRSFPMLAYSYLYINVTSN